jgi:hypothetical protein
LPFDRSSPALPDRENTRSWKLSILPTRGQRGNQWLRVLIGIIIRFLPVGKWTTSQTTIETSPYNRQCRRAVLSAAGGS